MPTPAAARALGVSGIDTFICPAIFARLTGHAPQVPTCKTGGHVLFAATTGR